MFEAVAESRQTGWTLCERIFGEPVLCDFGGFAEAYDCSYVFGSGAALSLMGATVEHGGEPDAATNEESADALGRVDLVAREGEEIDFFEWAVGAEIDGQFACGLNGVGVEERAFGMSVGYSGELGDGLNDAGLVVGEDNADEFGIGAESGFERGWLDEALWSAGEKGDLDIARG